MITKTGHSTDMFPRRDSLYDIRIIMQLECDLEIAQDVADRLQLPVRAFRHRQDGGFGCDVYAITPTIANEDQTIPELTRCDLGYHNWLYHKDENGLSHRTCNRCGIEQMAAG